MSMFINFPESHPKVQGMESVSLPEMVTVHQEYDSQKTEDVAAEMRAQLNSLPNHEKFKDKNICITVGSRGIPDLEVMRQQMLLS